MTPSLLVLALFSLSAQAQTPMETGYLVRVDTAAGDVVLDFGEKSPAKNGAAFTIFKEGEELTNPVTGKSLGLVETKIAQGLISEVHPLYAVGHVEKSFGPLSAGLRARLGAEAPAPKTAPAAPETSVRDPRWKSPTFDFAARALAVADFSGTGAPQTAIADDKNVYLYAYPPEDPKALSQYKLPGSSAKLLSLEAADMNADGKAELFATVFNEAFNRVETLALQVGADGRWAKAAEIPGAVRQIQLEKGRRVLAVQQLAEDRTFPFSSAYALEYKDGRYAAGGKALRFKRADWVYGFTTADLDGTGPDLLILTGTDLLRLDFKKGHWKSEETYGQTPVRFTWSGRILQCHPRMEARYGAQGFSGLYLVRNLGGLGGLAQTFGYFSAGEIVRKDFNGLGLVTGWKAPVNGYSPGITLARGPDGEEGLAALVVGANGKSSVWIYDP